MRSITKKQVLVTVVLLGLVVIVANNWIGLLTQTTKEPTTANPRATRATTAGTGGKADASAGTPSAFSDQPHQVRIVGYRGEDARRIAQRVYGGNTRVAEIALANQLIDSEVLANDRTVLVDINVLAAGGFATIPDPFHRTSNDANPVAAKAAPVARQQPLRRVIPVGPDLLVSVPENKNLPPTAFIGGKSYSVGDRYGGGTIVDISGGGVTVMTMSGGPRAEGPHARHKSKQSPGAPSLILEVEH